MAGLSRLTEEFREILRQEKLELNTYACKGCCPHIPYSGSVGVHVHNQISRHRSLDIVTAVAHGHIYSFS